MESARISARADVGLSFPCKVCFPAFIPLVEVNLSSSETLTSISTRHLTNMSRPSRPHWNVEILSKLSTPLHTVITTSVTGSDYNVISFIINVIKPKPRKKVITLRNRKSLNHEIFSSSVKNDLCGAEGNCNTLAELNIVLHHQQAPLRVHTIPCQQSDPWLSLEFKRLKLNRNDDAPRDGGENLG